MLPTRRSPGSVVFLGTSTDRDRIKQVEDLMASFLSGPEKEEGKRVPSPFHNPQFLSRGTVFDRGYRPRNVDISFAVEGKRVPWSDKKKTPAPAKTLTATLEGNVLHVRNLDMYDGTPVLDVKPYLTRGDCHPEAAEPEWIQHLREIQDRERA